MPEDQPSEAVVELDMAERCVDANAAALDILGVSLDELRAAPPGQFAVQPVIPGEQRSLRAQWAEGGEELVVGTAGVRRGDGAIIRVAYALEKTPGGLRARLWQVEGSPESPTSVFTVGDVLREWRAAERELTELVPGSRDWARTLGEIELLRDRYQELFKAAEPLPSDQ
jgi:PAS domain-containing protein